MILSQHFTLEEALHSQTAIRNGIDNTPNSEALFNISYTAERMEKVRAFLLNKPILVSSWFRNKEVNRLVGSADTSQHILGCAVDFICPGYGTPYTVCDAIMKGGGLIIYDQLIYEGTWVHISFAIPGTTPRKQVLTYMKDRSYKQGLHEQR